LESKHLKREPSVEVQKVIKMKGTSAGGKGEVQNDPHPLREMPKAKVIGGETLC